MGTILLTDEEYSHIQSLADDLFSRIEKASPRAATHYSVVAKLHADFIAEEDAKRARSQRRATNRERIQKAKELRRNRVNPSQEPAKPSPGREHPGAASAPRAS